MLAKVKANKRRRKRRWLVALAAIGILVYVLRPYTISPVIKRLIVLAADRYVGIQLTMDRVSGSYFGSFALDGLEIQDPGNLPIRRLSAVKISTTYSLWDLITGDETWLQSVELIEGNIALDLRTAGTSDPPASTEKRTDSSLPSWLPKVDVIDTSLSIVSADWSLNIARVNVNVAKSKSGVSTLTLDATDADIVLPSLRQDNLSLRCRLTYESGVIGCDRLVLNDESLVDTLEIDLRDVARGDVGFRGDLLIAQGVAHIGGDLDSKGLRGECHLVNLNAEALPPWLPVPEISASGRISLDARMTIPFDDFLRSDGTLQLTAQDARFEDYHVDELAIDLSMRNSVFAVHSLNASLGSNNLQLRGVRAQIQSLEQLGSTLEGRVVVELLDIPRLQAALMETPFPFKNRIGEHRFDLEAELDNSVLKVTTGVLATPGGTVDFSGTNTEFQNGLFSSQGVTALGEIVFNFTDLGPLGNLFAIQSGGTLDGRVHFEGPLESLAVSAVVAGSSLVIEQIPLGNLALESTLFHPGLSIQNLQVWNGTHDISMSGGLDIAALTMNNFVVAGRFDDLSTLTHPFTQLTGACRLHAQASGPISDPNAQFELEAESLTWSGTPIDQVHLSMRHESQRLQLEECRVVSQDNALLLALDVEHDASFESVSVDVYSLSIRTGDDEINLQSGGTIRWKQGGAIELEPTKIAGTLGELSVSGTYLDPSRWEGEVIGQRIELPTNQRDFLPPPLESLRVSSLDLAGRGTPRGIGGSLSLVIEGKAYETNLPFQLTCRLDQNDSRAHLRELTLKQSEDLLVDATASAPISLAPFQLLEGDLRASMAVQIQDLPTILGPELSTRLKSAALQSQLDLEGSWNQVNGSFVLNATDVITGVDSPVAIPGPARLDVAVESSGDSVRMHRFEINTEGIHLESQGHAQVHLSPRDLFIGKKPDLGGSLQASLGIRMDDLSWLGRREGALRRAEGSLTGDVVVGGSLLAPKIEGELKIDEGAFKLASAGLASLERVSATIQFNPSSVNVEALRGEIGGSAFESSGSISLLTENPQLDFSLRGSNLLLYRQRGVKVRADTDLHVGGSLENLRISGQLALTDSRFVQNIDLFSFARPATSGPRQGVTGLQLFSFREPPLRDLSLDIRVTSKAPFQLRNNVLRGTVRPEIRLQGTGEVPQVVGDIYVDTVRVSLPASTLRLEQGVLQFLESNPFVPQLDMFAETTTLGYDISMAINGPYDAPVVSLSSVPPLPNDDLLLLVLTGKPPDDPLSRASGSTLSSLAIYLGRDLLGQLFGDESTESTESILARFEFENGKALSRSGSETLEARFRFLDQVFGKNDFLSLVGERDEFDEYNMGVRITFAFK